MVTDRSCNNELVTTELVVQCRKSQVTYMSEVLDQKHQSRPTNIFDF